MIPSKVIQRICRYCQAAYVMQQPRRLFAIQASKDLPRITVPHKMQEKLLKQREQSQRLQYKKKLKSSFKSPLVVACKNSNYNHHHGQTYSDFSPTSLASYNWKSRKSAGDYFTLVCHGKNPALLSASVEKTFADFLLKEDIIKALQALGYDNPTCIQNAAIPAIQQGGHVLCAAETGSGKTLAYLLPALDMLLGRKRAGLTKESTNCPSIIILTPSRELADQIMGVAKAFQNHIDFIPHSVCGGRGTKARLAWPDKRYMDIFICTPGILLKLLISGQIKVSGLQQIILDEADTLLDDSFSEMLHAIMKRLQIPILDSTIAPVIEPQSTPEPFAVEPQSTPEPFAVEPQSTPEPFAVEPQSTPEPFAVEPQSTPEPFAVEPQSTPEPFVSGVQFVLVSATIPRGLANSIGAYLPVDSIQKVTTEGLHRLMPHVPQKFMRLLPTHKPEMLVKLLRQNNPNKSPVLVFCNSSPTSFFLMHILQDNGFNTAIINGDMQEKNRRGVFEKFKEGVFDILVATDIASRGLDTIHLQQVINYDFPSFISDYIHRAGRVGRVGAKHIGLVTSFISHKWEVDILWQIEISARKASELHNVNANIKRKLLAELEKKQMPLMKS